MYTFISIEYVLLKTAGPEKWAAVAGRTSWGMERARPKGCKMKKKKKKINTKKKPPPVLTSMIACKL